MKHLLQIEIFSFFSTPEILQHSNMGKSSSGKSSLNRCRWCICKFRWVFVRFRKLCITNYLISTNYFTALRAYVEVFSSKPPDWQSFVKFYVVPPVIATPGNMLLKTQIMKYWLYFHLLLNFKRHFFRIGHFVFNGRGPIYSQQRRAVLSAVRSPFLAWVVGWKRGRGNKRNHRQDR